MRPSVWGLWQALHLIDPFDETRADLRNALAVKAIVEAQGAKRAGGGGFTVLDFMPYAEKPRETEAGLAQRIRMAFGIPNKEQV